jgi:hypothetical protein
MRLGGVTESQPMPRLTPNSIYEEIFYYSIILTFNRIMIPILSHLLHKGAQISVVSASTFLE